MFPWLVTLYLIMFYICAVRFASREGYWSPVIVFGITAFYYYLSLPLELYFRGQEVFTAYPAVFGISPEVRNAIGISAVLALLGFVAGHLLSGVGRLGAHRDFMPDRRLPNSLKYLALFSLIAIFLLYRFTLFENLGYQDANERRYNDPLFGYLTRLCLLLSCLCVGVIVQRKGLARAPAFLIAALVVAWGFYTSDKNPILQAALGLSTYWVGARSRSMKHLYIYCGAAVLAIASLPLFSAFRAHAPIDIRSAVADFSVQNTDAKGPMISLVLALEEDGPQFYGSSYLYALVGWVPRAIWPNRPNDLAQEFAFDHMPNWQPGMGLGYSLLAEAYLNFGKVGVFLQYFGIAFGLGRLWRGLYNLFARYGATPYWRASLAVTYFGILAIMHRVPSGYVVQSCVFELLVPVVAFCWLDIRPMRRYRTYNAHLVTGPHRVPRRRQFVSTHSITG
ncbi:O-antigen polysaccharide polymerase Wzy [Bythopirellula goksoeyrii]|uniref:Uncharacterized protein n=1 Tax=Bythopirellula goksoeyrii TaxID=1400387 RepID=A0A5B9QFH3_9BACT|nr:O-antigen polysaccharide polymerase Wzy [Bythopirellula goksoeyrii]QEG36649.1 hypothetical protein Pr1d_39640 [Bythopirellula goksoeyrii]